MVQVNKVFLVSGNAGQGKTTIAKNLAFALRMFGFDVLLVDADLRTPKMGHHVGMPLVNKTIQQVLLGNVSLRDAIYSKSSGLKLLLSGLSDIEVPHPSSLLPELKKLAGVIIIDVPSYDKKWYDTGCDTILVSQADFPSVLEVQKLSKLAKVSYVVLNRARYDGVDLSPGNINELVRRPLLGFVPEEPATREALKYGYSIVEFHPELKASAVLKQMAAKLMNLEYKSVPRARMFLKRFGLMS